MRALRYYGLEDLRLEDIPEPECRPGCVKLRPSYVGICGTDISLYYHEAVASKPDFIHPLAKEKMPIVFGHEFGGVVTEVGEGVTRARVGDLVAVRPSLYDGTCGACVAGHSNVCQSWGWLGIHASGGLAEAAVVEQKTIFRLPPGPTATPELAALVEPLSVGWHATRLARDITPSSTALIIGGGPIGCAVYLALRAQGLTRIVVSEVTQARRDMLVALGAEHVLSPNDTDVVAAVRELSGGHGAHAVFDCAGLPVTLSTALGALQVKGTIVNVALRAAPVPQVDLNLYVFKEATLVSSMGYLDEDYEEVIEALGSGKLKPEAMVTAKIDMQDLVEKGIKVLAKPGQHQHCKILVNVQQQADSSKV